MEHPNGDRFFWNSRLGKVVKSPLNTLLENKISCLGKDTRFIRANIPRDAFLEDREPDPDKLNWNKYYDTHAPSLGGQGRKQGIELGSVRPPAISILPGKDP